MDIKKLREKIDGIDKEILDLLKERFSYLSEIVAYKQENNLPIEDSVRERELISKCVERGQNRGLKADFVREVFELIIDESKRIQNAEKK
jgi:chorismate mutase-like protein